MKWVLAMVVMVVARWAGAGEVFVGGDGVNTNPGTRERPVLTLERGRDVARAEKASVVHLGAGSYCVKKTLELDERDSGVRFVGEGKARIVGGIEVPADRVKVVTEAGVLERLKAEVRGKVMEIDLRGLGVGDLGTVGPRGFGRAYVAAPVEVVVDGEPLVMAQWPKVGKPEEAMGKVLDQGLSRKVGKEELRGGTFEYGSDRPGKWRNVEEIWLTGFFFNGYADDTLQVKAIDGQKKTITTVQAHGYGFGSGNPWNKWVARNVLEEMELAGEYVMERRSGKVYFLPPAGKEMGTCRVEVTVLGDPLVAIEGAKGVVFDGVNFECSRGMGVYIERGEGCRIENATMRNLGTVAVCIGQGEPGRAKKVDGKVRYWEPGQLGTCLAYRPTWNRMGGTGNGVVNCRIYNVGAGGVLLGGGDRLKLEAAGNFVENCEIHHFNRWDRTYRTAVNVDGVGNVVRHCLIHDCPGSALNLHGNNHMIEYNEIHHAMMDGDDMGAFYMGRDPTERGNVFRYNYWHDLAPVNRTHCMYFDDVGGDGSTIFGNVFVRAGNNDVIFLNGGSDFAIKNNIFIDCKQVLRVNGQSGNMRWLTQNGLFEAKLKAVRYNQSPWKERYPEMQDYQESHKSMPRRRAVENNLVVRSKMVAGNYQGTNNWVTEEDPGFVDLKKGDYRLKADAEVFKRIPGFEAVDVGKMGLEKEAK